LRICPACKTEHISESATTCRECGHALEVPNADTAREDDLEFRVYEKESDDREFVGGARDFDADADRPATPAPAEADAAGPPASTIDPDFSPIAGSEACVPEPAEDDDASFGSQPPPEEPQLTASGKIRRLTEEEVKSIAGSLYRADAFLSDKDKKELMKKLDDKEQLFAGSAPIEPPKRPEREKPKPADVLAEIENLGPSPKMAGRGRGVAYFYRNLIQLRGSQQLFAGDEIAVAGKTYELRRKTIGRTPLLVGGGVAFVVILFLVATLFVSRPGREGRVAGIVLDDMQLPVNRGASVVFPELGQTIRVNGQGMFQTEALPPGSHKVEVLVNGKTFASDYVTVAGGELSLIALKPMTGEEAAAAEPEAAAPSAVLGVTVPEPAPARETPGKTAAPPKAKPKAQTSTGAAGSAGLKLAANVDGARLTVDGKVLGVGNLVYPQLPPGAHSYTVSREGYAPATGTITLAEGKTQTLEVTLAPLSTAQKLEEYSAEDYYLSGLSAVQEQDYQAAVTDLRQAVGQEPGHADAWFALGQAHAGVKDWPNAHDAFLRAAEIYRFGNDHSRAITAYNAAIRVNDKSAAAYLGRGDLFLQRGDERAAAVDFETVVRLDRRNPHAYIGLGRSRMNQGMYEEAIKHFKDARSIEPNNPVVYQYLMLCHMAESNFDEVRRSYAKFAETASENQMRQLQADQRYAAALRVVNGHP